VRPLSPGEIYSQKRFLSLDEEKTRLSLSLIREHSFLKKWKLHWFSSLVHKMDPSPLGPSLPQKPYHAAYNIII
jgi:hypothetical protein